MHPGYKGRLHHHTCRITPSYVDRNTEIIYQIPYLFEAFSRMDATSFWNEYQTLFTERLLHIILLNKLSDMNGLQNMLSEKFPLGSYVFLVLIPLKYGLYHVRILRLTEKNYIDQKMFAVKKRRLMA
jgi:hypothetical protein